MSGPEVRWATDDDLAGIGSVARATGSAGEAAGDDPRYLAHLRERGGLAVATSGGEVVGYGGRSRTHGGAMLTDLFVLPDSRSRGVGSALLDLLWGEPGERLTFASSAPPAAALYARRGPRMLWPLLYLTGSPGSVGDQGLVVEVVDPSVASGWDSSWQRLDDGAAEGQRSDYRFWAGRPDGFAFVVRDAGEVVAAGCVGGDAQSYGVAHLNTADATVSGAAVLAAVRAARGGVGRCLLCLPGPHPAVRPLLDAGFRMVDHDLHMATEGVVLEPTRQVLHPGLV